MGYLIGFDDDEALNPHIVGQKFYSLAKAFRSGFAVPNAVAISTEAHRYFLTHNSWPDGLAEDVLDAACTLDISQGLSIRSSAIREDLEKQSFAGQYRTFLRVVDRQDLQINIEACWLSVASESVQSYQQANKSTDHRKHPPLMGVVIQKMVNAIIAGIAFGRNPMQPAGGEIVIEAVEGLAEDLVGGRCSPYRAVVDANGTVKLTAPESKRHDTGDLSGMFHQYSFWQEIACLVRDLEKQNGKKPLDIEWAVDAEKRIWLLQSRPITTLDDRTGEIPPGLWTRKIANDLWADRLTPFLAQHMVSKASKFDLTRTLRILGIPISRPTLTVIHGYLYINCENIRTGMAYIPLELRLSELKHLLPPSARSGKIPPPRFWRLVEVSLRSLLIFVQEPGVNPAICLWLARRHYKLINRKLDQIADMPTESPRATMRKINSSLEVLSRLQVYNQWPYFFAMLTTWVHRWLAVDCVGLSHAGFLERISENARNVTIDIERRFRKIAGEIAADSDLVERFLKETAYQLKDDLPWRLQTRIDKFLTLYGCRSRHRTLLIKRWAEAPEEVIGILQALVRNQKSLVVESADRYNLPVAAIEGMTNSPKSKSAEDSMRMFPLCGSLLWLTTRFNRRFLDLREDLRFAMDRVLFLLRQTMLILGEQTNLGDKVLFLRKNELNRLIEGDISYSEARHQAKRRYDRFMKPFDVATYLNNGRAEDEFEFNGIVLRGLGTSPGRVQGHAKIVDNPVNTDIKNDDILIARNTDPGWTPILSIVKGMVIEEGGLLNHCSIVARELGIPSVVGVRGATRQIRDNDLVTIDGGLGIVRIEK